MSKDEREFLEKLRATSIEAAAEVMQGLQRLRNFHDEMFDGGGEPPSRPRVADYFYQLAKLELEHASSIMRLGSIQAEMLFDHVRQLARGMRGGEPPLRVLELTRSTDTAATSYAARFELRNPFDRPADVRFHIPAMHDENDEAHGSKPVARSHPHRVPPHGTFQVEVVLEGAVDRVLFGHIDVFVSAELEKRIAHRALKVRPHG